MYSKMITSLQIENTIQNIYNGKHKMYMTIFTSWGIYVYMYTTNGKCTFFITGFGFIE